LNEIRRRGDSIRRQVEAREIQAAEMDFSVSSPGDEAGLVDDDVVDSDPNCLLQQTLNAPSGWRRAEF
jgi:hypothetical protein